MLRESTTKDQHDHHENQYKGAGEQIGQPPLRPTGPTTPLHDFLDFFSVGVSLNLNAQTPLRKVFLFPLLTLNLSHSCVRPFPSCSNNELPTTSQQDGAYLFFVFIFRIQGTTQVYIFEAGYRNKALIYPTVRPLANVLYWCSDDLAIETPSENRK
jgi:hypothetical protein